MKNSWKNGNARFIRLAAVAVAALLIVGGCATMQAAKPSPVTVSQVIEMSKAGTPPQDIINRIKDSGTVYRLNASQLADLRQLGVSDQVIDYMQQTYLEAVRRDQARKDLRYYRWGPDGYWYGGVPYGWW
jgi:hypothetical protein